MFCTTSLSPFCTPGQFVFLVVLATSTLTIALLGNRLRDIILKIKCRHHPDYLIVPIKKEDPNYGTQLETYNQKSNNATNELRRINQLILFQVGLIFLSLIRIIWSAYSEVPLWYDQLLVWLALLTLGILWLAYFWWVTYIQKPAS